MQLAITLYDFKAEDPHMLSFKKGEQIKILERGNENWYKAEKNGEIGFVATNYILPLENPEQQKLVDKEEYINEEEKIAEKFISRKSIMTNLTFPLKYSNDQNKSSDDLPKIQLSESESKKFIFLSFIFNGMI